MKHCITPPQFCQELFAVALNRRRRCEKRGVQLGLKAAVRIPSERRRRRGKRSPPVCRKMSFAAEMPIIMRILHKSSGLTRRQIVDIISNEKRQRQFLTINLNRVTIDCAKRSGKIGERCDHQQYFHEKYISLSRSLWLFLRELY